MPTDRLCVFTTKLSTFPKIIQIWDTPGDPKYHYLTIGTAIKANLALLFVDVTNEHTALRAKTFLDRNASPIQNLLYRTVFRYI